jgi:hypothetical protein
MVDLAPAPLHAFPLDLVPLQAVPPPEPIQAANPMAIYQEGAQDARAVQNRVENRVEQQLKWIEKLLYLCIVLALYAIFKK